MDSSFEKRKKNFDPLRPLRGDHGNFEKKKFFTKFYNNHSDR
jgi:hypothetical protein